MLWRRYTLPEILFTLLCCTPLLRAAEAKITVRPQYDQTRRAHQDFDHFKKQKRPKVALVLSGGGARGVAQIGVLKALERHNIPIDFIAATSLGAIVGGLYASGYTTAELESLALNTNWDDILSLSQQAKRTDLIIDQKLAEDWSFLVVRFQGLEPVIPPAVSSGQRLTNFLSTQALQAVYHPNPSFDDLKIPFRAIATDLVSGRRIVLKDGSLAEALRASSTVPLLFNPIERDSMQLVDGGLVSNIPVDITREAGCDIVIVVNSTSGLRKADELKAPWETADQIMGIMMQLPNDQQLEHADVVITPAVGRHLSTDFRGLDSLIAEGERTAEERIPEILALYQRRSAIMDSTGATAPVFKGVSFEFPHPFSSDSLVRRIREEMRGDSLTLTDIRHHVQAIYNTEDYADVTAEIYPESRPPRVVYSLLLHPDLRRVEFSGCRLIAAEELALEFQPLLNRPLNRRTSAAASERILRLYRKRGYSLARIGAPAFDEKSGTLHFSVNEGVIDRIDVQGGVRTQDPFVLREFPLEEGDVFNIDKALQGITNINSMKLFEYVYLEVSYPKNSTLITIRLSELPSQLVRFGLRADNERNLQGTVDIRDENFHGTGAEFGFTASGGARNGLFNLEYKSQRLFSPDFNVGVAGFYSTLNSYQYGDAPQPGAYHWDRVRLGEYVDTRYGARLIIGTQLERLGNATVEYSLQHEQIRSRENLVGIEEHYQLALVKVGTVLDSRDRYPFPATGIALSLSYEFASKTLGSDIGYNALRIVYESYTTWGGSHTFHPKFAFGFADKTMPLGQQFRLGGRESLVGVREDDRRGRQLIAANIEYRFRLPLRIVFETYLRVRYDLGSIASVPEEIKFNTFRHGVGAEAAFDTPVGQAAFGVGQGFYFDRNLPDNPITHGPLLFYFMIGYEL